MNKLTFLLSLLLINSVLLAQTPNNCDDYTTTGSSSSSFNPSPDVVCTANVSGLVNGAAAWSGASCSGTLVSTSVIGPVSCMTIAYTAVNIDDFAIITTDGGGTLTITGINIGVSGNVIGPYNCGSAFYGDVSITICSTIPFTEVTLVNTGCSSGWVINCGGCSGTLLDAGADNLTASICGSTIDLNSLVTGDSGGIWEEITTSQSGQFNAGTGVLDGNGLSSGIYNFIYYFTDGCGAADTAFFDVTVGGSGNAGADNGATICNTLGSTINLNTLLIGADAGGVWNETSSSGQFNVGSGVFDGNGLGTGGYTFTYVLPAISPCLADTAGFVIIVSPPPSVDFEYEINGQSSSTGTTSGCMSFPVSFTDFSSVASPGTITNWNWDFGDLMGTSTNQNPVYQYTTGGTFTVVLTVTTNGGCSLSFNMDIEIFASPNVNVIFSTPTCYQFTDGSIVLNTVGGTGSEVFTIKDSAGTVLNISNSNAANNLGEGWYYYEVDNGGGCNYIDSVFIDDPDEMTMDLEITNPACYGVPSGIAQVGFIYNATGNPNNISYFWNPNPGNQSGLGADSTGSMEPGVYTITINDENGCSELFDFTITYPPELIFNEFGADPAYCRLFGFQKGNGVIYASASGGTPDYDYEWINLEDSTTNISTTWGGLNPGTFEMTVTDNNGCKLVGIIEVDSLNPIADFDANSLQFLIPGALEGTSPVTVTFDNNSMNYANPNNPQADTTFFWNLDFDNAFWYISDDLDESIDTTYTGEQVYNVCLVAINKNGCTDTLCKEIIVHDVPLLDTPNIFTPGSSGTNDEFTFEFLSQAVDDFTAVIVNRWGKEVFVFNSITDSWNGDNKGGNPCNDGVYFYTYEVVFTNGDTRSGQGNIQLIRE